MIRKAIIVLLTLGAVGTGVLWVATLQTGLTYFQHRCLCCTYAGAAEFLLFDVELWPTSESQGWSTFHGQFDHKWMFDARPIYWGVVVTIPLWFPLLTFAAFPAMAFVRGPLRRWRRRRNGWCVACGYDLTGNVSGICPECGKEI